MSNLSVLALTLRDIFPYPLRQGLGLVILVVIIVFWVMYRRKQM